MSSTASEASDGEEAITKEEIQGTAPVPQPDSAAVEAGPSDETKKTKASQPRNAFAELMRPKPKQTPPPPLHKLPAPSVASSVARAFKDRNGLGVYLADPAAFPPSRVIYHNADFVAIHDLYPKSSVHTLLLPRSPRNLLHPFDAFEDAPFLASVQAEVAKLRAIVAAELQRRFGRFSAADAARNRVLDGEEGGGEGGGGSSSSQPEQLPPGRDWAAEVKVGIHAHPSMSHLHVHVLSRDMHGASLKHRKHYNSFNTPFLVDVADFPLADDDPRRHPGRAGYMNSCLLCWRCGREFGNKFKALKEHLEVEFEAWRME